MIRQWLNLIYWAQGESVMFNLISIMRSSMNILIIFNVKITQICLHSVKYFIDSKIAIVNVVSSELFCFLHPSNFDQVRFDFENHWSCFNPYLSISLSFCFLESLSSSAFFNALAFFESFSWKFTKKYRGNKTRLKISNFYICIMIDKE